MTLQANYQVEASCDDYSKDIEECYYTNEKHEVVHVTTHTIGYYYSDGSTKCEACHDGNS